MPNVPANHPAPPRVLLRDTDAELTLYLRRAGRLKNPDPARATIVEGGVLDAKVLKRAMSVRRSLGVRRG